MTPDLTNTSFEFNGVTLVLTSQSFTGQANLVVFTCFVPETGVLAVSGPIPVDPPQPIPTGGVPVEYSNDADETVAFTGTTSLEVHGGLDPGQTIYAEPVDLPGNLLPDNGLDFFPAAESGRRSRSRSTPWPTEPTRTCRTCSRTRPTCSSR